MQKFSPMPVLYHGSPPSRVDSKLWESSHVFLRIDAVRRPLVPPYEGPFPVLERYFRYPEKKQTSNSDRGQIKASLFLT